MGDTPASVVSPKELPGDGVDWSPEKTAVVLQCWLGHVPPEPRARPLTGGCCYLVLELSFLGSRSPAVLKVAREPGEEGLARESRVLDYLGREGLLTVPAPLLCDVSGARLPHSFLLMERLPGLNLAEASPLLSRAERDRLEREMGEAIARLHTHTGQSYGSLDGGDRCHDWSRWFGAVLAEDLEDNGRRGLVRPESLRRVERLLERLPQVLDAPGPPCLVHGDIWATNVMVSPGGPRLLSGFLDPGGLFAHREYELAYLEVWGTVGPSFFQTYHTTHPPLPGYPVRRLVYWLHTLLLHVSLFGDRHFVDRTEQVIAQLAVSLGL